MRNLISAGLYRVRKNTVLRVLAVIIAVMLVVVCANQYHWVLNANAHVIFDKLFLSWGAVSSLALAVFSSLFLGSEYVDGTLRNKLITGHTRSAVYLSGFITCCFAGLVLFLVYAVVLSAIGLPLFGFFRTEFSVLWPLLLDMLLLTAVFAAIFTTVSMLIPNRAVCAVLCICIAGVGLLAAGIMRARLDEPETFAEGMITIAEDGQANWESVEDTPNPLYLPPRARAIVECAMDILPFGQALRTANLEAAHPLRMIVCTVAEIVIFNLFGLWLFSKKDIQ